MLHLKARNASIIFTNPESIYLQANTYSVVHVNKNIMIVK